MKNLKFIFAILVSCLLLNSNAQQNGTSKTLPTGKNEKNIPVTKKAAQQKNSPKSVNMRAMTADSKEYGSVTKKK